MSRFAELFRSVATDPPEPGVLPEPSEFEEPPAPREGFTLLFVDDEPSVLRALQRIFLEEDYKILTATQGEEALRLLDQHRVQLVISDHRMPGMTGAEMLREIKQRYPEIIRIMLTGFADVQSIMGAVNEGAVYKFITKPWNDEDLRLTVSLALQQYALLQENKQLKDIAKKQQQTIKSYSAKLMENRGILGNILGKAGLVKKDDFLRALRERQGEEFITETLVRLGITEEPRIIAALQQSLHIEYVDLRELALSPEVVRFLPRELCEKSRMVPIRLDRRQLTLAMADPSDIYKCDNIALMTGLKVTPVLARSAEILERLRKVYDAGPGEAGFSLEEVPDLEPIDEVDIIIEDEESDLNVQELISSSEIPPIIRIVNAIISEAVRYRASDIHIEPKTKYSVIRYRIDGILHSKIKIPAELHPATISRVKILSKLDIAERRRPQDGRITVKSGTRLVDIRVSTMPTISGEKVVMRILDKSAAIKKLDELGVLSGDLQQIHRISKKPQGIIISTGPTGSGKTTMLYSMLGEMLDSGKNFETIEEPVEYFLEEANQVTIREKIGLSFSSVLRATLRQDPDVILVGEIRDQDTADVAFKAALTGHMVLTTLHTNSSVSSITRLMDIGVKPYLIASALEGVIAQRLVRKVCKYCRVAVAPNAELLELLKIAPRALENRVPQGKGCARCNHTGYLGRTGVFELFVMNDDFRHFICERYKESELLGMARAAGMKTLIDAGVEKVRRGETTLDELLRVIGPQIRHERSCGGCDRPIDAKFLFCPYCGAFKKDVCTSCRMPLEEDWRLCAFCGVKRDGAPHRQSHSSLSDRLLLP